MVKLRILITGIIDLEYSRQRLINRIIDLQNARDIRLEIENYRLALKDKRGISCNRYNGNKGLVDSNYSLNKRFRILIPPEDDIQRNYGTSMDYW
jgi:hypothetical protein